MGVVCDLETIANCVGGAPSKVSPLHTSGPAPQDSALRPKRLGVQRSVPPQLQKDKGYVRPIFLQFIISIHIIDIIDLHLHEDVHLDLTHLTSIHPPVSNFTKLLPTCHHPPGPLPITLPAQALDPDTPRPCSPTLWKCSWCRCRSPSGGSRTC